MITETVWSWRTLSDFTDAAPTRRHFVFNDVLLFFFCHAVFVSGRGQSVFTLSSFGVPSSVSNSLRLETCHVKKKHVIWHSAAKPGKTPPQNQNFIRVFKLWVFLVHKDSSWRSGVYWTRSSKCETGRNTKEKFECQLFKVSGRLESLTLVAVSLKKLQPRTEIFVQSTVTMATFGFLSVCKCVRVCYACQETAVV